MAKKKKTTKKSLKDEKKKNSPKSLPKGSIKKNSRGKTKSKRRSGKQSSPFIRSKRGKLQKKKLSLKKRAALRKIGIKSAKGRIRDFKGRFVEAHYQARLKRLKQDLIRDGAIIDGKKVTRRTTWATITKAIYENKLFTLAESHRVSYFDVLGKIVTEVNELKPGQEIFVKVKPFFRDQRVFSIKHKEAHGPRKSSYFSQAVMLNPQMVMLIEDMSALVQRVVDEFPRKIDSPLFKIKERRYENPLTGSTYALEYDYNDILPSGMDLGEFIDFLQAIMGDEYKRIAILRMRANLGSFGEDE